MRKLSRRHFMKGSLATAAGIGVASSMTSSTLGAIRGANEDVRVAIIGVRGKGGAHINDFNKLDGVRIVALCDPDSKILADKAKKLAEHKTKPSKAKTYTDVRRLLDDKDIDAVVVATPNHWHSLITIWACQAGKDVYVEKPISHNIFEGQQAVAAAKKYNRIVQTGTQNRSDDGLIPLMKYIHEGNLGAIQYVHSLCYRRRKSIGKVAGPQPIPSHIDYNLWTGPAQMGPLMRKSLHYDWHWLYETGNGDIGNQGVHEIDLAAWAIQATELAPRVVSFGGRYGYDDDANTANTQISILDYKPAPIISEVRALPMNRNIDNTMDNTLGVKVGIIIKCEDGYFAGGRGGGRVYDNSGNTIKKFPGDAGGTHQKNFIDAVRSRKSENLRANIQKGHISAALCHMLNISYQLGTKMTVEQATETIKDHIPAVAAWRSVQNNLFMNWVDLAKEGVKVGPWLEMDTKTEKFKESSQFDMATFANMLAKGTYRAPFVVPEQV